MGFFDVLKKKKIELPRYAQSLNGGPPLFSYFGEDIFASDVVQQAIACIVTEMKKLQPRHIRKPIGGDSKIESSNISRILASPNLLMTASEFIEKIVWALYLDYNAFVIPVYELRENGTRLYTGLYPVRPDGVEFLESGGSLYIRMKFANGFETTLPYGDVIHIRMQYSVNNYMGGDEYGMPDRRAFLKTLKTNDALWQGIGKSMQWNLSINGIIKYNTLLDDGAMKEAVKNLEQRILDGESGFLPMDAKGEFIPFPKKVDYINPQTLKFIDEKILRTFGVSLAILTGDYTKEQYEAFYGKTVEPLIVSLGQAFTKTLFSPREIGTGNKIVFYSGEAIFMTVDQKLELLGTLGAAGSLYENEKRTLFGLMPLEELEGVRMQSLNWINTELADDYQLGKSGAAAAAKEDGDNAE
ncbi:MAG: phage portal protein [Clostridiales Family XIII bacterium]|jgi:HK97 family phage portal protein|nr:phage portal protein [Clostridiales Family XIII bacterium]